jgi:hypothetical protein
MHGIAYIWPTMKKKNTPSYPGGPLPDSRILVQVTVSDQRLEILKALQAHYEVQPVPMKLAPIHIVTMALDIGLRNMMSTLAVKLPA